MTMAVRPPDQRDVLEPPLAARRPGGRTRRPGSSHQRHLMLAQQPRRPPRPPVQGLSNYTELPAGQLGVVSTAFLSSPKPSKNANPNSPSGAGGKMTNRIRNAMRRRTVAAAAVALLSVGVAGGSDAATGIADRRDGDRLRHAEGYDSDAGRYRRRRSRFRSRGHAPDRTSQPVKLAP